MDFQLNILDLYTTIMPLNTPPYLPPYMPPYIQSRVKSKGPKLIFSRFRVKLLPITLPSTPIITMLRTPLGPISSNQHHRPKLTPYKKGIINRVYKYSYILIYIVKAKNIFLIIIKKTIY